MFEGDDGPVYDADHFLGDGFDPHLKEGELRGDAVDGDFVDVSLAQVGLVEHEWVVVEAEEVASCGLLLEEKEVVDIATSAAGGDPFGEGAIGAVAVVEDVGGPAGGDLHTIVTVVCDCGDEWPVLVLGVEEEGAGIVTDSVFDTANDPGTEGVTVVKACDGGWDETVGTEHGGRGERGLSEPGLIPADFVKNIVESGVVLVLVGKGVGDMSKDVAVGWGCPPGLQSVFVCAGSRVRVCRWLCRPQIGTGAKRSLHVL